MMPAALPPSVRAPAVTGARRVISTCWSFRKTKSLLTSVGIERELSEALGIKVDLLTEQAVSPYLIGRIRDDLKVIHGQRACQ
jgi:hypothetical protein